MNLNFFFLIVKNQYLINTQFLQDFVQFLCQTKMNSIDRIKEMVITAFVYCTGL